jgi:hypothetical protein
MDVIKKKYYHLLSMRNEQNGVAGVCGNKTMNTLIAVHRTEV